MRIFGVLLALGMSSVAVAQDETSVASGGTIDHPSFRYGYSSETYETSHGDKTTLNWVSFRSGHITGAVDSDMKNYRLRVNANGGSMLGVQNTELGKKFLNRFQVELGGQSNKVPYALGALELPLVKPVTLFVGTVHNPGGSQRFVVGPVLYYSNSHSLLFYYPKASKSESVVENTLVLRNRIREFGDNIWLDLDGVQKSVESANEVEGFKDWGYGVTLGLWKLYGKYSETPYYEGTKVARTTYEVGIDASF